MLPTYLSEITTVRTQIFCLSASFLSVGTDDKFYHYIESQILLILLISNYIRDNHNSTHLIEKSNRSSSCRSSLPDIYRHYENEFLGIHPRPEFNIKIFNIAMYISPYINLYIADAYLLF